MAWMEDRTLVKNNFSLVDAVEILMPSLPGPKTMVYLASTELELLLLLTLSSEFHSLEVEEVGLHKAGPVAICVREYPSGTWDLLPWCKVLCQHSFLLSGKQIDISEAVFL